MENDPDCFELLTMPLDKETEEYLRRKGAGWFLDKRRAFAFFLAQQGGEK